MNGEHVTTQILNAVAARLADVVGVETSVGPVKAVRVSRVWPTDLRDLPALSIYSPDETVVQRRHRPGHRIERRAIRLQVMVAMPRPAAADNDLESDLGKLKVAIEGRLGTDPTLVGGDPALPLATDLALTGTGSGLDPSSALTVSLLGLSYSAIAHHPEGDPTTPLTRIQP